MHRPVEIRYRDATPADAALLREVLYLAIHVPPGQPPAPRSILEDPVVRRYIDDWGRPGDTGIIATTSDDRLLGAAYLRLFTATEPGYGFIAPDIPELAIACVAEARAHGIGTALMQRLLDRADLQFPGVSLSVAESSPAVRLYQRFGFTQIAHESGFLRMLRTSPNR